MNIMVTDMPTEKDAESLSTQEATPSLCLEFQNAGVLPALFGEYDCHLKLIESLIGVTADSRGEHVMLYGQPAAIQSARTVIEYLYDRLEQGRTVGKRDVKAAVRMVNDADSPDEGQTKLRNNSDVVIRTRKKNITPYTNRQADYVRMLYQDDLVFALGPAGTGKTYLAVAVAVSKFIEGKVERIILSRPAVEAGEKLGYLPGDLKEKVDPYLRPLYDALHDMLPAEKVTEYLENGIIEIAPLAFMRGRTLSHAFVILDEAQNTTTTQMKMFLTRLGEHSRMVVTGDMSQVDLPAGQQSGLREAVTILNNVAGIGMTRFTDADVVRHPLAASIIRAYDAADKERKRKKEADGNRVDKASDKADANPDGTAS